MTQALSFEDAEYPAVNTNKAPNKFADMVKEMASKNVSRKITMPNKTEEDKKNIKTLIATVQAAGREVGVTVNKKIEELTGKDAGKAVIYFKTREKISRSSLASTK